MTQIFTKGEATDVAYRNLRAARNDVTRKARAECERLWETYEPYADPEFRIELRSNFHARYWEMYLTCYLIGEGYAVQCPKPGPDVGIEVEGRRIWFEATAPSPGASGTADRVSVPIVSAPHEEPVVNEVPNEKLVLRYLNSITTKFEGQYLSWLKGGIVTPDDAFVIAINPRGLGHEYGDTRPPRILQAAFPLGALYVTIDRDMKFVGSGYQFRDAILKSSGAQVSTGVFFQENYAGLSALLCSRVDAVNQPEAMGQDFQLVPNPRAKIPLPEAFRLNGTYFRIERSDDSYIAIPEVRT